MMPTIDTATQLCAVIGNPVGHSLSPQIHNAAFQKAGLNYVYLAFQVEDLAGCLAGMRALPSFRGLSVTIPHKQAILPLLDEVDPVARHIGSVNTVVNDGGRLRGLSTDGPGTLRAFADAGVDLRDKRVLFLGTGGAVRAVAFAMAELAGVAHLTLLGRTPENTQRLAADLQSAQPPCVIQQGPLDTAAESALPEYDVIINGTPLGMIPEYLDRTPVNSAMLKPGQVAFDMVYRPRETRFLAEARQAGATVIDGLAMLVNQAALQFECWTGHEAPRASMWDAATRALQPQE